MSNLKQQHYINGQWLDSDGDLLSSQNPADSTTLWQAKSASAQTVASAVSAAKLAFESWKLLSFSERESYVHKFVEQLKERQEELGRAIHEETGKPLWESKTEIGAMIAKAGISINAYQERTGSTAKEANGVVIQLAHRPIGVFAVLGPYNFPGHLPNGHIIPSLLAGNTIVFKPSELTPRFGELMIDCWSSVGLPAGVVNLIQGARETGEALVANPDINGVLFTGSSKTGHAIHKALGGQPDKMLALEMGGNNPLIVDAVSDLKACVYTIIQSAFISAGQRCTCARRLILVDTPVNRELLDQLAKATSDIKVGSDDNCFIGPVVSNAAADAAVAFEEDLLSSGGKSIVSLGRKDSSLPFLQPGIIDVTEVTNSEDEECFGPLLQVRWVASLEEAVESANDTRYGLSAGLLSDNESSWDYFYPRINAGIVNYNRPLTGASGAAPFGGTGASGNFRPGAYYAADYSAYPIASMQSDITELPATLTPGVTV